MEQVRVDCVGINQDSMIEPKNQHHQRSERQASGNMPGSSVAKYQEVCMLVAHHKLFGTHFLTE